VTNRYEQMRMQRAMQRRIRLVVEERRMALGVRAAPGEGLRDPEATVEIPPQALRAIGRASVNLI
jgi:hypothetical protein